MIDFEDRHTLFDSLVVCRFFRDFYGWDELSLLINGTTGMNLEKAQLQVIASSITNKVREFNIREGMQRDDDVLPKRFFVEKLQDSRKVLFKAEFDQMVSDYYRIRGW